MFFCPQCRIHESTRLLQFEDSPPVKRYLCSVEDYAMDSWTCVHGAGITAHCNVCI